MDLYIWIPIVILCGAFLYSGIPKSLFAEGRLVAMGQTGVEGLPPWFIKFIGISEILGVLGLVLPRLLNTLPEITTVVTILFGMIMVPAAIIHYRRGEPKNVATNVFVLFTALFLLYQINVKGR